MAQSFVADKNYLERPELEAFLTADAGNRLVLSDWSAIEAHAGNPIKNAARSLRIASKYPQQILVLRNSRQILELGEILPPFRFDMVNWHLTRRFPIYCEHLLKAEAGSKENISILMKQGEKASQHLASLIPNMPLMVDLIARLSEATSLATIRARRSQNGAIPHDDALELLRSIYDIGTRVASQLKGVPPVSRNPAAASRHVAFRFAIALRLFALWWTEQGGGLKEVKPEKLRNDFVDLIYVTVATYWDGFLTAEKKMLGIYEETRYIANNIFLQMRD
jgi:hypothetical protein